MLQGTSSHVGKSIITTALCRIFLQDGAKVVPFKAQNMALNSFVTKDGGEMGRAQVAQAEAAGLEPNVDMNPVLLKPTGNSCSQVILKGKPVGNMSAREYHNGYSLKAWDTVKESLDKISAEYDTVVIEGAGSPAEINLKANDIVNMRVARYLNAPVLLIADIDRGGSLASIVGTLELLEKEERDLVKGLVINKFRGDISLFDSAVEFLEKKTGKPVIGVVPHLADLGIDDEDSVSLDDKKNCAKKAELTIGVIRTPKISNFTDFDSLANEPDVNLVYVRSAEELENLDLLLLAGSKNTIEDLLYLKEHGLASGIKKAVRENTPLIGICGGYQMLGEMIFDPQHTESEHDFVEGLGLLTAKTTFAAEKRTTQVRADYTGSAFLNVDLSVKNLLGYEIHMGRTEFTAAVTQPLTLTSRSGEGLSQKDGAVSRDGLVMGTYVHGIFDNDEFRRRLLNELRRRKGLSPLDSTVNIYANKQKAYNRLADTVRNAFDMKLLYKIMEE
jgi:adenosylcobyric acid synthase